MLGMHTVGHFFWGTSGPYHDMPLLLGSSIQSGQSVAADVVVLWGMCGLVSVLRMHTVSLRLAAAVINCVICCCGAVVRSAWADWAIDGILSCCWWGGAVALASCLLGWLHWGCWFAACLKSLSASSRISAVSVRYKSRERGMCRCPSVR
jgi:hypothetical protein